VSSNPTDPASENRPTQGMPGGATDDALDRLDRARWWLMLAGVVAGLAAFGGGEMILDLIPAKSVPVPTMGQIVMAPTTATANVALTRNGALAFGLLGLCLGGLVGTAGGLARRSAPAIVLAGLVGALLGMALAAGASLALIPVFLRTWTDNPKYELVLPMIMHAPIWGLTGAAAGMAFAVGWGDRRLIGRALAAGFVGAALGAIAFELIGAGLFPLSNTGMPISTTWPSRLLARLLVTLATAAFVSLSLPSSPPQKASNHS